MDDDILSHDNNDAEEETTGGNETEAVAHGAKQYNFKKKLSVQ
jgi:hypothetical protein